MSFDRAVDRALSRGRRSPEATLDLHGMTLAAAERAVRRFLEEAVALDLRLVLIVTGKGLRQESGRIVEGRIRAEFPGWLSRADNRAKVRGVKPAYLRHGGSGAFYVQLRRR
jgi:DNA-nicking Smr family endonuclease